MTDLKGKVAIITGGSGGMGKEISFLLGKKGVRLVLMARRSTPLEEIANQIVQSGGEAVACSADVSKKADVKRVVETVLEHFKQIDFLVCTAGVGIFAPITDLSESNWDLMMDVNLKGPFLCCKAVLPTFLKQKRGHIINISSLAGTVGSANLSAYSASKAGLIRFSESLLKEVRSKNIKVSTICPGSTNTGFGESRIEEQSWKMAPRDVAEVVYNLLSSNENILVSDVQMRPLRTSL